MEELTLIERIDSILRWRKPICEKVDLLEHMIKLEQNKIKADYEKEIERLKARLQASQEDNNKIRGRMHDQWMNQNKIKADAVREAVERCKANVYTDDEIDPDYIGEMCDVCDLIEYANKLERGEID